MLYSGVFQTCFKKQIKKTKHCFLHFKKKILVIHSGPNNLSLVKLVSNAKKKKKRKKKPNKDT